MPGSEDGGADQAKLAWGSGSEEKNMTETLAAGCGLMLSMVAMSSARERTTRIVLVNSNIPSGAILKGINEHCHSVVLIIDASKPDSSWRHRSIKNRRAATSDPG